ncbi:iron-containing alcohol dehydrogenase [Candidatus Marinimicrobia bacterium]|nr:iron-containing alcohol dehydrogenase [Candidatus Neomarinimicrobiota bacterium]
MLNFFTRYFFPKEIAIKKGSLQRLKFLNLKNPILFYSTSAEKNGFVEKIKAMFPEMKLYKINSREPKLDDIRNLEDFSSYDEFIAIGGGSVIDTAKLLIAKSVSGEVKKMPPFSLIENNRKKPYFIAIPTTVGSGSESDGVAVFEQNSSKIPIVSDLIVPDLVILDPAVCEALPDKILLTTAIDAFSHGFESYFSKISNEFSKMLSLISCKNIINGLGDVFNEQNKLINLEKLLYGSYMAGLAQSTTSVGIIHAISHVISPKVNLGHGHLNTIILPHILKFYHEKNIDINAFAKAIGLKDINELISIINSFISEKNIQSISSNDISIDADLIDEIKNDMCFKTSPISINDEEITSILEQIID